MERSISPEPTTEAYRLPQFNFLGSFHPDWRTLLMLLAVAAVISFLLGSIPCSLLLARGVGGIDLRQHGSGNVGATNVVRTLGLKWGVVAFLLDGLKGYLPVLALPVLLVVGEALATHLAVVSGISAVVGHMFPPWLKFKGGKGVATAFGVVLGLAPWGSLLALGMFLVVFALSRIVSLSSICAVLTFPVAQFALYGGALWQGETWSLGLFGLLAPALIIIQHRTNIVRLWRGEEKQLSFSKPRSGPASSEVEGNSDGSGTGSTTR